MTGSLQRVDWHSLNCPCLGPLAPSDGHSLYKGTDSWELGVRCSRVALAPSSAQTCFWGLGISHRLSFLMGGLHIETVLKIFFHVKIFCAIYLDHTLFPLEAPTPPRSSPFPLTASKRAGSGLAVWPSCTIAHRSAVASGHARGLL